MRSLFSKYSLPSAAVLVTTALTFFVTIGADGNMFLDL